MSKGKFYEHLVATNNKDIGRDENTRKFIEAEGSPLIIAIMGILVILAGSAYLNSFYEFKSSAVETEALIHSERTTGSSTASEETYRLYAEYEVNGKKYIEYLETFSTSGLTIGPFSFVDTKDGDLKTIYYNPNNPSEIKSDTSALTGYIMLSVGIICVVAYLAYLAYSFLTKKT